MWKSASGNILSLTNFLQFSLYFASSKVCQRAFWTKFRLSRRSNLSAKILCFNDQIFSNYFVHREFLSIFSRSNIFFFKKCRWTVGICTVCFVSTYIWIIIINLLKKVSLQLILYVFIFSTWRLSLDSKSTVGYKQKIGAEIEFRNQMMCHLSLNTYIYLCT